MDIIRNWSVGGTSRHIEVKQYFFRELKEQGIKEVNRMSGTNMIADVLTKSLPVEDFERQNSTFVCDEVLGSHEGEIA